MTAGSSERGAVDSDTARNEQLLDLRGEGHSVVPYKALWGILLLGWVVSYADRTVTGPVIAWMIQNESGFIGDAANPATLGGLVGSMFFLGYMLTQYSARRRRPEEMHRCPTLFSPPPRTPPSATSR